VDYQRKQLVKFWSCKRFFSQELFKIKLVLKQQIMEPFFRRNRKSFIRESNTALRALQERKIKPVGSNKEIAVDIRIITATNEDLREAVKKGDLRRFVP
jgi:hypothetical protein